ncbi:hypothetical protein RP726_17380 [Candidatus Methylospira mobilis]|uniref:bestrophin-like domain n=1 Tax=Candidatus Methylospira mobilis TaxID=1808979 RepID=UPI0028EECFC9|nr:hypothetical protein [Candidatus Methylospira mobilis]WNV04163.1 hypothetical protein RP726_17380 [Candidatus Methylospira mobilis]
MVQWLIIVLLLAVSVILPPLMLWWLSQRSKLTPFFYSLAGVAPPFIGLPGMLFSLNLAFVCNETWQYRETAKSAMSHEADALRNIGRIASNIPERGGIPILDAVRQYLDAACSFDFPEEAAVFSNGSIAQQNNLSLAANANLADIILNSNNLDKLQPSIQQALITQLSVVRNKRLERLSLLNIEKSKIKWISLIYLELITLLSIFIVHVTNGRALLIASFLFLGGVNPFIFAIYSSQSPFSGLNPVNHKILIETLDRVKGVEEIYKNKTQ